MKHWKKLMTGAGFAAAGLLAGSLMVAGMSTAAPYDDRGRSDPDRMAPRCLDARHIGGKHVVDEHTLLVYDDFGNGYKLDVGGPCRTMDDYSKIGFEFDGTDQICKAHDAKILFSHWDEAPLRCIINGVQPLTRAEAAELEKN